jgi:hypothetical protein
MRRYFRQFVFILFAFVLRMPIWFLIWAIGRTGLIKTVFLIYPIDTSECLDFTPDIKWLRRFFAHRPTPAGFIMHNWIPVGIYCCIASPALELMRKKNRPQVENIMQRMRWIRKISGAKTIGLAGQLGPIFEKRHNIPIEPPFYASTYGNIYSIQSAVRHMANESGRKPWQLSLAVLGGGELGDMLEEQLAKDGYHTSMVDVRYTRRGTAQLVDEVKADHQLADVDLVVNLFPRGVDFLNCRLHERMPPSATVIDFSRPPIDPTLIEQHVVMGNRVQRSGTRFFMRLPGGWKSHELPACSMPTLVASLGGVSASSLEEFRSAARGMAFRTALASPPEPLFVGLRKEFGRILAATLYQVRTHPKPLLQRSRYDTAIPPKSHF